MNCFNHTDLVAVGQCTNCGKFLCKECAAKYTPILCTDCVEAYVLIQEEEQKKEDKKVVLCYVLATISFIISYSFFSFAINYSVMPELNGINTQQVKSAIMLMRVMSVVWGLLWAGIPFGWRTATRWQKKIKTFILIPAFIFVIIKFYLSVFIGWACLLIDLVKRIKQYINKKS